jgi:hypothetical protein
MEKLNTKTIKGIYSLTYGYSDHISLFVSTREEINKCKEKQINLETSKYAYEDVDLDNIQKITEDLDFIEKFEKLGLSNFHPLDFIEEEEDIIL